MTMPATTSHHATAGTESHTDQHDIETHMAHRKEQVQATLLRTIGRILAEGLADPRIAPLTSVTRVQISDDLRAATVFVSVMPADAERKTIAGLGHSAGHIQGKLRQYIDLRRLPKLTFKLDESLKKQAEIFDAINQGMAREQQRPTSEQQGGDPPHTQQMHPPPTQPAASPQQAEET